MKGGVFGNKEDTANFFLINFANFPSIFLIFLGHLCKYY